MKFSLSQAFRSLMVCILRKYFQNVCVLVFIIPLHLGSYMHSSPCRVWPAVKMDKHTDICALKALCMCTFPSVLSVFVYMLLPNAHHMSLGVLSFVFLCWHKNSSLLSTFLCLPFQNLPLKSKLHESRSFPFCPPLYTQCNAVPGIQWMSVNVLKEQIVGWLDD